MTILHPVTHEPMEAPSERVDRMRQKGFAVGLQDRIQGAINYLQANLENSRDAILACDKLQEALFWGQSAVQRYGIKSDSEQSP